MTFSRRFARAALILAALALAPTARAATLDLIGPAGAEVVIDGEVRGVLPLAEPLVLPPGQVIIVEIRAAGYRTHTEQVYLETPETRKVVEIDLLRLSRRTATISSALLAGTGQMYQRRWITGWVHMGLQLAAWGAVVAGELEFKDRRDAYEVLDQEYRQAIGPALIAQLRTEREAAWDDMQEAKNWRNAGIGAVVVIAAWSAFDAWRGHDRFFTEVEPASASLDGSTTLKAGLAWNFGGGSR